MNQELSFNNSLKPRAIEEFLDYYFYRRVAARLVPLFIKFRVSPNQITSLSLVSGLIGAGFVYRQNFIWAVLFALTAIFFDCCDGQVARLTGQKSPIGRAMDGFFDLLWVTAYWLALHFSGYFQDQQIYILPLMISSAASMIIHCWRFDAVKIQYLEIVDPKNLEGDLDVPTALKLFREKIRVYNFVEAFFALLLAFQMYFFVRGNKNKPVYQLSEAQRRDFKKLLEPVINHWSFLGEGHHNTMIIVGTFLALWTTNGFLLAFWTILLPMNLWWIACEINTHRKMKQVFAAIKKV